MAKRRTRKKSVRKPPLGEETGLQRRDFGVAGILVGLPGFGKPVRGTYANYRLMRSNPTVAIGRVAATAPIRTADYSFGVRDGTPEERVAFVRENVDRVWPRFVRDAMPALDYGWAPFENIWDYRGGRLHLRRLKPLLVDITRPLIDRTTGDFMGLKNRGEELAPNKSFVFSYDGESGNIFGRSRHENIRKEWSAWDKTLEKLGAYTGKVSGVVPIVEYPIGQSKDKEGKAQSNFDLASAVLQELGRGKGVAMPNVFAIHAKELIRSGVNLAQLKAWHISFLQTKGDHSKGMIEALRHFEKLMLRGWLVPERSVTEGQYGTKAEAGAHADIGLVMADLVFFDLVQQFNEDVLDLLLVVNYGEEARGSVWLKPSGLSPGLRAFFRSLLTEVLSEAANVDLLLRLVDLDSMIELVGLPKMEGDGIEGFEPKEPEEGGEEPQVTPSMTSAVRSLYALVNDDLIRRHNRRSVPPKTS